MRLHRRATFLCTPLFLACGSYTPPDPPAPRDATAVHASMGRSWDAVIELFAARTIPIRTIERASGLIVTEQLSVGPEGHDWADCGKDNAIVLRPNFATYNVLVRGDSQSSSVKAAVRWVRTDPKDRLIECSTTHVWEQALEEEVKTRAEEQRAVPASAPEPATYVGEAPATTAPSTADESSAGPAVARTNAELLADSDFRRAIQDLRALKFLAEFQEAVRDTLLVEVSNKALPTNLSEYSLGRLFRAYYRMTNWSPRTVILFSHAGLVLAAYRRGGLSVRERR